MSGSLWVISGTLSTRYRSIPINFLLLFVFVFVRCLSCSVISLIVDFALSILQPKLSRSGNQVRGLCHHLNESTPKANFTLNWTRSVMMATIIWPNQPNQTCAVYVLCCVQLVTYLLTLVPIVSNTLRATRLWSPELSIAMAISSPPKNIMLALCDQEDVDQLIRAVIKMSYLHVGDADVWGGDEIKHREECHRKQGCGWYVDGFQHPVGGHQEDNTRTPHFGLIVYNQDRKETERYENGHNGFPGAWNKQEETLRCRERFNVMRNIRHLACCLRVWAGRLTATAARSRSTLFNYPLTSWTHPRCLCRTLIIFVRCTDEVIQEIDVVTGKLWWVHNGKIQILRSWPKSSNVVRRWAAWVQLKQLLSDGQSWSWEESVLREANLTSGGGNYWTAMATDYVV